MRVQRLEAEGLFSFGVENDRFALDLDYPLTAIVGPNASGKSNVGRLLKLVQAVASFEGPSTRRTAAPCSRCWRTTPKAPATKGCRRVLGARYVSVSGSPAAPMPKVR